MANVFTYTRMEGQNVDSIRILSIRPATGTDLVQCRFSTVRLSENPRFTALSYVWGTLPATEEIEVDGKTFCIRMNLWKLLTRVRRPSSVVKVWADAICINQADIPERNQQVRLMSSIYSLATSVVAWLGEATTHAGQVLKPYIKPSRKLEADCRFLTDLNACWHEIMGSLERRRKVLRVWDAIAILCRCPYWRRKWILQEVALGRNVVLYYGLVQIPWPIFATWCNTIRAVEMDVMGDPDPLSGTENGTFQGGAAHYLHLIQGCAVGRLSIYAQENRIGPSFRKKRLVDLIPEAENTICSDPRDSVYALLSLASDHDEQSGLQPDYGRTAGDIFFEILAFYLNDSSFWFADCLRSSLQLTIDELKHTSSQSTDSKDRFSAQVDVRGILKQVLHRRSWDSSSDHPSVLQFVLFVTAEVESDDEENPCEHTRLRQCIQDDCYNSSPMLALLVAHEIAKPGDVLLNLRDTEVWLLYSLRKNYYRCIGRVYRLRSVATTSITELQCWARNSHTESIKAHNIINGDTGRVYFGRDMLLEALSPAGGSIMSLGANAGFWNASSEYYGALAFGRPDVDAGGLLYDRDRMVHNRVFRSANSF